MAKAVFRPGEVTVRNDKVVLQAPESFELAHLYPQAEAAEETGEAEEAYLGPTADDLRQEADEFRVHWEIEKETMISSAKLEAERIIKNGETEARERVERKESEAEAVKQKAAEEAEQIIAGAQKKAGEIEANAGAEFENRLKEAREEGKVSGNEEGYAEGKAEVERLIQRTQVVLERAQDLRAEVLAETEQQIIDLALLITRKVVKAISESQRAVVLQNVAQALKKVKARGTILIRVNMADLKLTTEHSKTFIQMMEGAKGVQIVEDSSVDPGGCIIETDFGEVDARISSQLAELEAKILELSPIKGRAKSTPPNSNSAGRGAGGGAFNGAGADGHQGVDASLSGEALAPPRGA
ncbi:MAG: flagellar assembly protein FliH [Treponema sp.]|jgi:flagellar assembly protein FliH|nr:flagellar assembly protein FliH [Treponema sp.]